jgi:type VI secretion system protein ImpE
MTTVRDALKEGRLEDAMALAADAARREPARAEHRVLLFQLYAVDGAWPKALRQLDVLSDLDPKMELLARTCRPLIAAEAVRASVFKGERAPLCLGRPPDWLAPLVEALHVDGDGRHAEAADLRAGAFDAAEAVPGTLDGTAFSWLADGDERLGPVLEAVVNGSYWWIPLARIARIELDPPEDLRDLVWLPARLTWANQGEAVGFVPSRYPGSETSDDAHKLARRTDWRQLGDGSWAGIGQRMLATDQGEHPLLEVREIVLEATDAGDGSDG